MNVALISGWLTADPEFGPTTKGQYCNFTLGVHETSKFKKDRGLFIPVVCYDDAAERIKKTCVKGTFITITNGKLISDEWVTKEGQKRSMLKLQQYAFEMSRFGDGKEDEQGKTLNKPLMTYLLIINMTT